ncbi:AI-2E family transporter [Pseudomonas sp.]|uniref:AI-2E family transporter n=1 Tax=Pseudomonas sp. TaxID=306 RepID=UPI00272B162B|nr:AI-2E family transporter [Pseudomonas sp.]
MQAPDGRSSARTMGSRALIQASVYALVAIVCIVSWLVFDFLLLMFAAVLFGVLITGVSRWLAARTGMPYPAALATFLATVLLLSTVIGVSLAPSIAEQFDELTDSIPEAVERLQERAEDNRLLGWAMDQQDRAQRAIQENVGIMTLVTGLVASVAGAVSSFFIALAIGICFSLSPGKYVTGLLKLVPPGYRPRAGEVLHRTGSTLKSWLLAKLLEMLLIGILTTLGLWLLGIELAMALGLIAGLLSFIPNIGPIIAVIPALLLASLEGFDTVLWVAALYIGVQALESWGLTPYLQKRIVDMPPAITLSMQILFGLLAGTIGLILATPLAAAAMVLINMIYVRDILGDRDEDEPAPDDSDTIVTHPR